MRTFQGVYTALITPMKPNKRSKTGFSVEYDIWRKLIRYQIRNGVDGLVLFGTTGESIVLEKREKQIMIRIAQEEIAASGRSVKLVLGTGDINPYKTVDNTKWARDQGADAAMVVSPCYARQNSSGTIKCYEQLEKVSMDLLLYNVPKRTGRGFNLEEYSILAQMQNIKGTKEASGDMDFIKNVIDSTQGMNFDVISGDDALTVPIMKVGGTGVVSVASNCLPAEVKKLVDMVAEGETDFRGLDESLAKFTGYLFKDANPVDVKAAMSYLGLLPKDRDVCRLPNGPMDPMKRADLRNYMVKEVYREFGVKKL